MDRLWGIWGSYYNIPEAIFYPIKGDYIPDRRLSFPKLHSKVSKRSDAPASKAVQEHGGCSVHDTPTKKRVHTLKSWSLRMRKTTDTIIAIVAVIIVILPL